MTKDGAQRDKMLNTNISQAEYYNQTDGGLTSETNGAATNLWRRMRQRAFVTVSKSERNKVYEIHAEWMGDLSDKKVLELGVGHGSPLTRHISHTCKEYHGLDLSRREIELLKKRLPEGANIHTHIADFLSDDFDVSDFDIIYAHSVFHHFKYMGPMFDRIKSKLAKDGTIITYDPLQVWLPVRLLRALYRPFQTDANWEFPFTRKTCKDIEENFDVVDRFGVFNYAKWAMLLGILSPALGKKFGDKWFAADLERRGKSDNIIKSLHISYFLKLK